MISFACEIALTASFHRIFLVYGDAISPDTRCIDKSCERPIIIRMPHRLARADDVFDHFEGVLFTPQRQREFKLLSIKFASTSRLWGILKGGHFEFSLRCNNLG